MKALCKRHRFFDERIKVSFPTGHGNPPKLTLSGRAQGFHVVASWRVWTLWITGDGDAFPRRRANPKVAAGLVEKAAELKSQVDEASTLPDLSPLAPDIEPPFAT